MTLASSSPPSIRSRRASLSPSKHLRPSSPSPSLSATDATTPASSLHAFRRPRTPSTHARASSMSTLGLGISNCPPDELDSILAAPKSRTSWRWRSNVLGHFSSRSVPLVHVPDTLIAPRPSTSSTATQTTLSATPPMTSVDGDAHTDKMSLASSLHSRTNSHNLKASIGSTSQSPTPSVWSLPVHRWQANDATASMSTPALPHKQSSRRLSFVPKSKPRPDTTRPSSREPYIAYSAGNKARVSFSGSTRSSRRKKKLVISGIGLDEVHRYEALKRWCEVTLFYFSRRRQFIYLHRLQSFGEVSQITRMPNGELHVHFKKAEVADTVSPPLLIPVHRTERPHSGLPSASKSPHQRCWQCLPILVYWQQVVTLLMT